MPQPLNNLSPQMPAPTLFDSTSVQAGRRALRHAGERHRQILQLLKEAGSDGLCIFEVAERLSGQRPVASSPMPPPLTTDHRPLATVFDHQISGRFGELEKALAIQRTGRRRTKPATGCQAEVYTITTLGLGLLQEGGAA